MDDLLTSNFPVFNASRRELTSWRVSPQIGDHLPWITLYFETRGNACVEYRTSLEVFNEHFLYC